MCCAAATQARVVRVLFYAPVLPRALACRRRAPGPRLARAPHTTRPKPPPLRWLVVASARAAWLYYKVALMRVFLPFAFAELSWIYDSSMSLASSGGGMLADTPRAAAAHAAAQAAQAAMASAAAAAPADPPAESDSPDPYGWRRSAPSAAVYKPAASARASGGGGGGGSGSSSDAQYSRQAVKERAAAAAAAAVCSAAYFGAVDGLEAALARGGSVSSRDETGMTPLHWAAHGGHGDVAQALLQRGSDLSATNRDGWTPLHFASCAGHVHLVKQLLRAGAAADAPNAAGRTPLQMAKDASVEAAFRNWG